MASAKEVRRRIKSVVSTKQIIKAMELISVIKMQKAIAINAASRNYSEAAEAILWNLVTDINEADHPFLLPDNEATKQLVVIITSDRGLCGGLNSKAIRMVLDLSKDRDTDFLTIGRKGRDLLRVLGKNIIADFTKIEEKPEIKDILPISKIITDDFVSGKYKGIKLVYTHFVSTLAQEPTATKLLPLENKQKSLSQERIVFEPEKHALLDDLIPRLMEIKIWQSMLESIASEHSARMMAMKNASENAVELIDDLTLAYNQTRQANITREIAEISAGKMTLEG